jgi:hypothetical protein
MRLNDGLPVWHASITVWDRHGTQTRSMPELAEREAIKLLTGVGNHREWWIHQTTTRGIPIGHLRVGITDTELRAMTEACGLLPPVTADAGESGPERPRTQPR